MKELALESPALGVDFDPANVTIVALHNKLAGETYTVSGFLSHMTRSASALSSPPRGGGNSRVRVSMGYLSLWGRRQGEGGV